MNDIEINDIRLDKDFKGITFSKYKKTEVRKELLNNISEEKIEAACNWCAELVCAGHYMEIWEIILLFLSKNIHLANPKLPIYIETRYQNFRDIVGGGYAGNELTMRNNPKIRRLFCEIICILCFSNKKHRFEIVKIDLTEVFDISKLSDKLKAPNMTYAQNYFLSGDPKEIFITVNEFAYSISENINDSLKACYWVEWIIEFENKCRHKKEACKCERREFANVEGKFQKDIIWIFWQIILDKVECKSIIHKKIINSILHLFCIRYNSSYIKKRRYLIYFAINILTEKINLDVNMIPNKVGVEKIVSNIDTIYKQIKRNEDSPKTDYLFANTTQTNLEKTIQKMDIMNQHIIPRA
jgi:hypothetical protein